MESRKLVCNVFPDCRSSIVRHHTIRLCTNLNLFSVGVRQENPCGESGLLGSHRSILLPAFHSPHTASGPVLGNKCLPSAQSVSVATGGNRWQSPKNAAEFGIGIQNLQFSHFLKSLFLTGRSSSSPSPGRSCAGPS